MSYVVGYVTFKNSTEAKKICKHLVKLKLIACANILAQHTAIYEWENKTQMSKECSAVLKTKKNLAKKIELEIKKLHSYKTPCIVFWPLTQGSKDFLQWIDSQTRTV